MKREYVFETSQTRNRRRKFAILSFLFFIFFFATLSFLYLMIQPQILNEQSAAAYTDHSPDLIAIFTGDRKRLDQAFELAKQHPLSPLLISGVYSKNTVNLLLSKVTNQEEQSYFDERLIELDYKARNTFENVLMTLMYIQENPHIRNILVVSSDYHLARIRFLFYALNYQNLDLDVQYHGVRSHQSTWQNWKLTFKELLKFYRSIPLVFLEDENRTSPRSYSSP